MRNQAGLKAGMGGHYRVIAACAAVILIIAARQAGAALLGVENINDELIYEVDSSKPVTLLLSKSAYPAEDGHVDAIVWLGGPEASGRLSGRLELTMRDGSGRVVRRGAVDPVPGERIFFSMEFPPALAGRRGSLEASWRDGRREVGSAGSVFRVREHSRVPVSGRVRLEIPNERGVRGIAVPVTVGVPFPRGALKDPANVRLLDSGGAEVPLQAKTAARWSRFGSIRWLQCDFKAAPRGGPDAYYLEFGPRVKRSRHPGPLMVREREGAPPLVDTGPLIFGDGIMFDPDGGGHRLVVTPAGLEGGFVERDDGMLYLEPADAEWEVEDSGQEKAVLLRRGWYIDPATGEKFCRFNTRFILQRGSALVRIFHTWIYTGEAYSDRIRNMGWRLGVEGMVSGGFLGEDSRSWHSGDYLLQYDYDHYKVSDGGRLAEHGGRAPGIARAEVPGAQMLAGVKDFWQNFPNELEFADDALYVHQWPRHGRPSVHPARADDGLRLWFAHEGEVLDFAVPIEWTESPDFYFPMGGQRRPAYQLRHRRHIMNAQGIAKTSEMWLLFAPADAHTEVLTVLLEGLNDATLRAHVDPEWMASSGAFYEIRHQDFENFPEEERAFEAAALAPMEWVERIRFYGKWVWGDMTWDLNPGERTFGLYRGFRKGHHGWPYSWIPYARSGDPRLLRFADAATRYMTDVAFCHYSDERVPDIRDEGRPRSRGFHIRHRIPWSSASWGNPSSRGYGDKADYMLHSYYMTGYERARDVLMDWACLTKYEGWSHWASRFDDRTSFYSDTMRNARAGVNLLKTYVQMYEAVFDPWFLAAAHQISNAHLEAFREEGWAGSHYQSGSREFHRFSGCDEYKEFYLAYARQKADVVPLGVRQEAEAEPVSYAYNITGDEYWLRRVSFFMEMGPEAPGPTSTSYWLQYYPFLPASLKRAGYRPEPMPNGFYQLPGPDNARRTDAIEGRRAYLYSYKVYFLKREGESAPVRLFFQRPGIRGWRWRIENQDGEAVMSGEVTEGVSRGPRGSLPERGGYAVLDADEPAGIYSLIAEGESAHPQSGIPGRVDGLFLPVAPAGSPEVWELGEDREVGPASRDRAANYWFYVPEGVEDFWIEFLRAGAAELARISILDPDGKMAWPVGGVDSGPETSRAEVEVPEEFSGRLWRVRITGRSRGFRLDPRISPYLAVDPEKWFDPGNPGPDLTRRLRGTVEQGEE